jgi:methylated-DNA-[protein]-cysteine S-methyltransferase
MKTYTTMETPMGRLVLEGDGTRVVTIAFADPDAYPAAREQLREYFAGERTTFDFPTATTGTPFQQQVWAAIDEIPYGTTTTYGQLAERVGAPRDRIRAVAAAVGANPLLVARPCHRVVGANGSLTGYAAGVERKDELLTLEGARQPQLI